MTNYDETNRGSIWKNDRKETDSHPDFTGSINVEGVEYWLNGWRRAPDANPKAPAMKFTVRPKEQPQRGGGAGQRAQAVRGQQQVDEFADDSIPF